MQSLLTFEQDVLTGEVAEEFGLKQEVGQSTRFRYDHASCLNKMEEKLQDFVNYTHDVQQLHMHMHASVHHN